MLKLLVKPTLGLFMAASLVLATGCGGSSSGSDSDGNNGPGTSVPIGGNNLVGPADPIQDALVQAGEGAEAAPVLGDPASALISSLVALLDAPDGLATGFQNFIGSQDVNDLFDGGENAGNAILSFASGLEEALIQLTEEGQAIPGSEALLPTLIALQEAVQDGTSGANDGGNLTVVTDLLVQLAGQLDGLADQVPAQAQDAPLIGDLLTALSGGAGDLAIILDSVGRLDGDDTSAALIASFENVLDALTGSLPGDAGAMLPAAVTDATAQFQRGLAIVLNPLFQGLRGVLAPITGDSSPLAGLLSGDIDGLAPGDGAGIPLLSGLPLLGDILPQLPGGEGLGDGGLGSLTMILEQGGTGGIPLLGDLLANIPGLSQPGGTDPISPAALTDLLTSLFSLNEGGVPVLGDVLGMAGGADNLNPGDFGSILQGLLGNLTGMFGGVDANGGFLDGSEGLGGLGGILTGLLDGLLGGLLGGLNN